MVAKEKRIPLKEGHSLYTKTVGEGEIKLLTIHGGPGLTHECFANFPDHLNPRGIQVVMYDQLGSWHSDQPADPELWNIPRFVEELHQVVEALELENQFVFANSWGSMLLIEYLLKYKTPFKGVIISGMSSSFRKFMDNITLLRQKLPDEVLQKLELYESQNRTADPAYQQLLVQEWYMRHYCVLQPWPAPLLSMLHHIAVPVMMSLVGANPFFFSGPATQWDRTNNLKDINTPTLLIGGKQDIVFEEDLEFMAQQMPDARTHMCPNDGHFCWWKDDQEFFAEVASFILERA